MKKILIPIVLFPSFALVGQESVSSGQRSWSGLLVSASCPAQTSMSGGHRPRNPEGGDQLARTTDRGTPVAQIADDSLARTTTPPIDDNGTRGKATINNTAANDAANRADATHNADRVTPVGLSVHDGDVAKGMEDSCRIGQTTGTFALRLADGSVVKFDDASNSKIAQQIQSGDRIQKHKTKVFRAKVKGSLQSGAISAESIQM